MEGCCNNCKHAEWLEICSTYLIVCNNDKSQHHLHILDRWHICDDGFTQSEENHE